jgi:hypothetical protein
MLIMDIKVGLSDESQGMDDWTVNPYVSAENPRKNMQSNQTRNSIYLRMYIYTYMCMYILQYPHFI